MEADAVVSRIIARPVFNTYDSLVNSSVDFSLVLPCYNEQGLFADSMMRIRDALDASKYAYEIIFVDDTSADNTRALIAAYCKTHRTSRALYHKTNTGRGRAVADGMRMARADIVGYMDIDCEVSPVYLPRLIDIVKKKKADVVIGRRYYRSSFRALVREILSRGYQWISDRMIGTGGLDTETGYKVFRKKTILPILDKTTNSGWFWDTEIIVRSRLAGLRITEVPVLFLRRFDKHSSVNIFSDTLEYIRQLIRFRRELRDYGST